MNRITLSICLSLILTSTPAMGVPVKDYQSRLDAAARFLQSAPVAQREAALNRLLRLMPPREAITFANHTVNVENAWIRQSVDAYFEQSEKSRRDAIYLQIRNRLTALSHEVQQASHLSDRNDLVERHQLSEILSRREFRQHQTGTWLDRARAWLQDGVARLLRLVPRLQRGTGLASQLLEAFFWSLAAVVIFFLMKRGLRGWGRSKSAPSPAEKSILDMVIDAHATPGDLRRQARELAGRGEYRGAARCIYLSLLYELEARNVLELSAAATNRDYLLAVRSLPAIYPSVAYLTHQFNRFWYGQLKPSASEYQGFVQQYHTALEMMNHQ